jgi:flagellar hook-basal body complex protein FliE
MNALVNRVLPQGNFFQATRAYAAAVEQAGGLGDWVGAEPGALGSLSDGQGKVNFSGMVKELWQHVRANIDTTEKTTAAWANGKASVQEVVTRVKETSLMVDEIRMVHQHMVSVLKEIYNTPV